MKFDHVIPRLKPLFQALQVFDFKRVKVVTLPTILIFLFLYDKLMKLIIQKINGKFTQSFLNDELVDKKNKK